MEGVTSLANSSFERDKPLEKLIRDLTEVGNKIRAITRVYHLSLVHSNDQREVLLTLENKKWQLIDQILEIESQNLVVLRLLSNDLLELRTSRIAYLGLINEVSADEVTRIQQLIADLDKRIDKIEQRMRQITRTQDTAQGVAVTSERKTFIDWGSRPFPVLVENIHDSIVLLDEELAYLISVASRINYQDPIYQDRNIWLERYARATLFRERLIALGKTINAIDLSTFINSINNEPPEVSLEAFAAASRKLNELRR